MSRITKSHFLPIFFIIALFSICIFILGANYGKSVANTNTVIDFLKKTIKPSPTLQPGKKMTYLTYEVSTCGIHFVAPENMKVQKTDANYTLVNEDYIVKVYCSKDKPVIAENIKVASVSVSIKGATASAFEGKLIENSTDDIILARIADTNSTKEVTVLTSKEIFPLISESINFLPLK